MSYKRILTVQDISCVGQCSLTVALPILSASGNETCILPSAVLSTHTGGFAGYTFRDLTDDIPGIVKHWISERIDFDALYTGYLGTARQVELVMGIIDSPLRKKDALIIIDPAMGDNGVFYKGMDDQFLQSMKKLVKKADIIIPNITEACMLTGIGYRVNYDEQYIRRLVDALLSIIGNDKTVVITGVGYREGETGVGVYTSGSSFHYPHIKLEKNVSGTGDIFASAFTGALLNGIKTEESAKIAADFTLAAIKETIKNPVHWYGVKFETVLGEYIQKVCVSPQGVAKI
ncbi:MAG: pyridoxamine kinase [Bacteroidales bacterium]|nr:pyridoxamine kinase [Bacteroidales bacterium]MBQ2097251.1 pyridoxamine kinase [Bacteroidales bacterium]